MDMGNAAAQKTPDWLVPLVKSLEAFYDQKRPGLLNQLSFIFSDGVKTTEVANYGAALKLSSNGALADFIKTAAEGLTEGELLSYISPSNTRASRRLQRLLVLCGFLPQAFFGEIPESVRAKHLVELVAITPLPKDGWLDELFERQPLRLVHNGITREFALSQAGTNKALQAELSNSFEEYPHYVKAQEARESALRKQEKARAEGEKNKIHSIATMRANAKLKKMVARGGNQGFRN